MRLEEGSTEWVWVGRVSEAGESTEWALMRW